MSPGAGLWIRIVLMRIRIQLKTLMRIRIQIQVRGGGGGDRSAKNVHPPWQNPRYAPVVIGVDSTVSTPRLFVKARNRRGISRPIHTPPISPPLKKSWFGVFPRVPCTLSRTCVHHMVRGEVTPPPYPQPPLFPPPHFPPPHPTYLIFPTFSQSETTVFPETVFINVCGAQELPRNEFRQPM